MPISYAPSLNRLLASLDGVALGRLLPDLTLVELTHGDTVFESGTPHTQVYFPVTAKILLSYLPDRGTAAAISLVSNEGVIGIPQFLQERVSPCSAVVRDGGHAFRISAALLTRELNRSGPALRMMLAYARDLSAQMTQAVAPPAPGAITVRTRQG